MRGLVLIAPHFFTEDAGIAAVADAAEAYATTDLRERLARYHADVDNAFRGWNDVWLDPAFRKWDITEELAYIRVPILIVQGEADQYGTVRQIEAAREECYCPVEVALLPGAKHSPQREEPQARSPRSPISSTGCCATITKATLPRMRRDRAVSHCGASHLLQARKSPPEGYPGGPDWPTLRGGRRPIDFQKTRSFERYQRSSGKLGLGQHRTLHRL